MPGFSNFCDLPAPLRYRPRSKALFEESEKRLWEIGSSLGKTTVEPTGTARTCGTRTLLRVTIWKVPGMTRSARPLAGSTQTSVSAGTGFWPRFVTKATFPVTFAARTGSAAIAKNPARTSGSRFISIGSGKGEMVAQGVGRSARRLRAEPRIKIVYCYCRRKPYHLQHARQVTGG